MNQYEAVRAAFPDASQDDVNKLAEDRWFVHDVTLYLMSHGFIFGCGTKDGCFPYCAC